MSAKKKPPRKAKRPVTFRGVPIIQTHEYVPGTGIVAISKDAAASVALDGCTQHCTVCAMIAQTGQEWHHTCGRREMTQAEREVVEAAMEWGREHHRYMTTKSPVHVDVAENIKIQEKLDRACRVLRESRKR